MFLPDCSVNEHAAEKIACGLLQVMDYAKNMVIVSDYLYSDASHYDELTEKYRSSLAQIDRAAAKACDFVLEIAFSNVIVHKGGEVFGGLSEKIP
jgi:adenosylcobinamide kinase/adenosylcobinamide-phosphate guanylyltransferase